MVVCGTALVLDPSSSVAGGGCKVAATPTFSRAFFLSSSA